jgi:hypothetical protein
LISDEEDGTIHYDITQYSIILLHSLTELESTTNAHQDTRSPDRARASHGSQGNRRYDAIHQYTRPYYVVWTTRARTDRVVRIVGTMDGAVLAT